MTYEDATSGSSGSSFESTAPRQTAFESFPALSLLLNQQPGLNCCNRQHLINMVSSPSAPLSPEFKDNKKGLATNMETDYVIVFRFATTSM